MKGLKGWLRGTNPGGRNSDFHEDGRPKYGTEAYEVKADQERKKEERARKLKAEEALVTFLVEKHKDGWVFSGQNYHGQPFLKAPNGDDFRFILVGDQWKFQGIEDSEKLHKICQEGLDNVKAEKEYRKEHDFRNREEFWAFHTVLDGKILGHAGVLQYREASGSLKNVEEFWAFFTVVDGKLLGHDGAKQCRKLSWKLEKGREEKLSIQAQQLEELSKLKVLEKRVEELESYRRYHGNHDGITI